jgi:hypothetical protein
MGRWSYITLRGKQKKKVTIVMAYNCGHSTGLKTACQQQTRILSKLFRSNNLPGTPNPHQQFILDLQSWLSYLISLEHEIILSLGWSPLTFGKIHWDAHERAFCRLPRFYQHSTAKLIHSSGQY